ncbi:DUF2341 domain-containing protein [Candidatus Bathyarchaeota archaeon]|nr:DUF2341 domain-containing protein [Candidatus Bathyarchaeota archaeon]
MKNQKGIRVIYVYFAIFSVLFSGILIYLPQLYGSLAENVSYSSASGWLNGWQFRKSHDIVGATGAGTNYQVKINVFNVAQISALNAPNYSIPNAGYLAENIVYDSATAKYWWIFEDRSSSVNIKIASATSINGPWAVQSTPVIQETGHYCTAPHLAKFGSYWYIYYGRHSGNSFENVDIWVQKSSNVNDSYSASGISNPVLARGSSGSWDSLRVYEPYAFEENGTYYLFYMGQNGTSSTASNAFELTGYATSSSPASGFMKYAGNPVIKPANHGWDSGADSSADPFVFKRNGVFYVGVTASSTGHSLTTSIGLYTTTDFVNFSYCAVGNPILSGSGGVNWDSTGVLRGAVSIFNDTYYLSYTGCNSSGNYRYGITTLSIINSDSSGTVFVFGKARSDFADIRFTASDGTTLLNYWTEIKVDDAYATFWVQVSDDLSAQNQTIYIYYGKSNATTTSNGTSTFLLFDDFNGNLAQWLPIAGTWTVEDGNLTISPSSDNNYLVSANPVGTNGIAIRTKVRSERAGDDQAHPGIIWHANNLTGNAQSNDQVYLRPHQTGLSWANIQPAYYSGSLNTHDGKFGSYFNWNNWYALEVRLPPSGNVKLYGGESNWHDWSNQQYAYNHVGLVAHVNGKDYWDYILVRKFVDPEPSHGNWGTEESAPASNNHWQITVDFRDIDNNNVTSRVTWQLYNGSQMLNYSPGEYALLDGRYTLKTSIDSYLIDVRSLDTATYGNSTATINLQMKQHLSTPGGYVALNSTLSSISINTETTTNLTFTLSGSTGKLLVKVPHNAEYLKKDGAYMQTWTWDYPYKVILLDSTNSTYEFNFLDVPP